MFLKRILSTVLIAVLLLSLLAACTPPAPPTDPTEPTVPTVPTVPTTPTRPTEPTSPTEPTQPTEPVAAFDPYALVAEMPEKELKGIFNANHQRYDVSYEDMLEAMSLRVFGVFDGTYAIMIDSSWEYAQISYYESVAGMVFYYPTAQSIIMHNEKWGMEYHLSEAFEKQKITAEEVAEIYENYYSAYPELLPQAQSLTVFTDEVKQKIATLFQDQYGEELDWDALYFSGRRRVKLYGAVGGAHIFFRAGPYETAMAWQIEKQVGAYTFAYGDEFEIYAYVYGYLMTLEEAYESNYISDLQLRAIHDFHRDS